MSHSIHLKKEEVGGALLLQFASQVLSLHSATRAVVPASEFVNTDDDPSAQIFTQRRGQKSSLYGCSKVSPSGGYIQ